MISRFFIDRPIFASVLSAFIVIAGLAALRVLPVAQYPDILPPQVDVSAFYPGANAETVAETVAAPLEQAVNGVDDMLYLHSASAGNGALSMTVTFAIGTDPDLAAINVSNRVQSALSQLPDLLERLESNLTRNGVKVHWAETVDEANDIVLSIIRAHEARQVIKGKSMVSEEMDMNHVLEAQGIEALESDMGEYIDESQFRK